MVLNNLNDDQKSRQNEVSAEILERLKVNQVFLIES
jgi:hypothetical protein